jgi:hypothetical protein
LLPGFALPGFALRGLALPGLALRGLALPGLALPGLALRGLALPGLALRGLALPGLVLPGLVLPGFALRGLALLRPVSRGRRVRPSPPGPPIVSRSHIFAARRFMLVRSPDRSPGIDQKAVIGAGHDETEYPITRPSHRDHDRFHDHGNLRAWSNPLEHSVIFEVS